MVLRKIAQIGHPILRQTASEVPREEITQPRFRQLVSELIETMRDAHGAGLPATQIYEPWQVCVMEVGENPRYPYKPKLPLTVLFNPVIEPLSDERIESYEGCLSVPNLRGVVQRWARVRVTGYDAEGAPFEREVAGITAATFQHEVDHLFGRLFVDRVEDPSTLTTWDQFSRFREAEFRAYVEATVARYGS